MNIMNLIAWIAGALMGVTCFVTAIRLLLDLTNKAGQGGTTLPTSICVVVVATAMFFGSRALMVRRSARAVAKAEAAAMLARQERAGKRWQVQVADVHSALRAKMVAAETDWDMLFTYPALFDTSHRATRKLHEAARAAERAVTPMPADFDEHTPLDSLPYARALDRLDKAWTVALKSAKRAGVRGMPAEERRTIGRIRTLLTLAESAGASAAERDTAYAQIQKLVGKLRAVKIPQRATRALEKRTQLALTA